mmetsp:Transcript_18762/g.48862  ORF Transcript_18762/g.48862 Transcript_18762/m.48862 type:complete len:277 (-) Transcript_18762:144-974(-)
MRTKGINSCWAGGRLLLELVLHPPGWQGLQVYPARCCWCCRCSRHLCCWSCCWQTCSLLCCRCPCGHRSGGPLALLLAASVASMLLALLQLPGPTLAPLPSLLPSSDAITFLLAAIAHWISSPGTFRPCLWHALAFAFLSTITALEITLLPSCPSPCYALCLTLLLPLPLCRYAQQHQQVQRIAINVGRVSKQGLASCTWRRTCTTPNLLSHIINVITSSTNSIAAVVAPSICTVDDPKPLCSQSALARACTICCTVAGRLGASLGRRSALVQSCT